MWPGCHRFVPQKERHPRDGATLDVRPRVARSPTHGALRTVCPGFTERKDDIDPFWGHC